MPTKKVLVLGGNFAGLTAALSVKHEIEDDVSKSDRFQFNPSLIWIPFGKRKAKDVMFPPAKTFEAHGVEFVHGEATRIDRTPRRSRPPRVCSATTTWRSRPDT
jgi:sulfide:quinone oxidoreductase